MFPQLSFPQRENKTSLRCNNRVLRRSSSNRFIEHDVCWKTKNSVVECKASENVCENLLDVLGESETYFLPSGWKLENHELKFSSRLPLRNIHHIPVRGPRATVF